MRCEVESEGSTGIWNRMACCTLMYMNVHVKYMSPCYHVTIQGAVHVEECFDAGGASEGLLDKRDGGKD